MEKLLKERYAQIPPLELQEKYPDSSFIPLTKGQWAIVDKEDFEYLSQWRWRYSRSDTNGYAKRRGSKTLGGEWIYMHREIMKTPIGMYTDHINGQSTDNRRANLRVCSNVQNTRNQRLGVNNTSGFKGVSWNKKERKWQVRIRFGGKNLSLGQYKNPTDAALAYNKAATEYFGEFAYLNKIQSQINYGWFCDD